MSLIISLALVNLRNLRADSAEYEAECESYRAEGFTPHYCFHGTNRWTDYDNICGPCEDGHSFYTIALGMAHQQVRDFEERAAAVNAVDKAGAPAAIRDDLWKWAVSALPKKRY